MDAIVIVLVSVVLIAAVAGAVALTRRSPARLSEEGSAYAGDGEVAPDHSWQRGARGDDVMDRPAGPDAEPTGVESAGTPSAITERGEADHRPGH